MKALKSSDSPFGSGGDLQQLAMHLDDAKLFYKLYPALLLRLYPDGWKQILPGNDAERDAAQVGETSGASTKSKPRELTAAVLEGLADYEREFLETCYQIRKKCNGYLTPAEQFVTSLINLHESRPLTPEQADDELDNFKEHFADMVEVSRRFKRDYPEVIKAVAE